MVDRSLVLFLSTQGYMSPVQKEMLKTISVLADDKRNRVYYINNDCPADINQNIEFIKIDEYEDDCCSEESVFYTPVNYLSELLSLIRNRPNSKICLLSYSNQSIKWLMGVDKIGLNEKNIIDFFTANDSCAFYNSRSVFEDSHGPLLYIPKVVRENENRIDKSVVDKETINIGYYGLISNHSLSIIKNVITSLNESKNDKDVNIHIMGNIGSIDLGLDFHLASTGFSRLVFTGDLRDEEERNNYVANNIDIIVSGDEDCFDISQAGAPILMSLDDDGNVSGMFTWLFDSDYYVAQKRNRTNRKAITFSMAIRDIYRNDKKNEYADKCRRYVVENNAEDAVCRSFYKLMDGTSLTVAKCLDSCYFDKLLTNMKKKENNTSDKGRVIDNSYYHVFMKVQSRYKKVLKKIRNGKKKKMKVAFLVMFKESFPSRRIFELMVNDNYFDPYIIVIPNVSRSIRYQMELYSSTFSYLNKQYGERVIGGYEEGTDTYYELGSEYEIVFFCNPYTSYDHPYHNIRYFLDKDVLTLYLNYGFPVLKFWEEVVAFDFYNYVWKVCIETEYNLEHLKEIQTVRGVNGLLTGYAKMDEMINEKRTATRKTIIIAPHHTVFGWSKLNISNFLRYSDFFLELPILFPEIDFVFRPHPMLLSNLIEKRIWTKEKIDDYLKKIESISNIRYDCSDYYFDTFVNSDAMIHDCGSYIAEYLYTMKPCCYMMKSEEETMNTLLPVGQECMSHYYKALTREDIIDFIQHVVIEGNDPMKESREKYSKEVIMVNYPNVSEYIIDYLRKSLRK